MPSDPYLNLPPDWRDRLRRIIKERRHTARSIALVAGLGATTVSEWLNPKKLKKPSFASISHVMQALGVPMEILTSAEDNQSAAAFDDKALSVSPVEIGYAEYMGKLKAGAWREPDIYSIDEIAIVPMVPHPEFANIRQYAWRVSGNSMNRFAKNQTFVIGVSFWDIAHKRKLQDQDVVVCEKRDGGKREYTLKRAVLTENGFRLDPESSDERHQSPAFLSSDPHGEEVEVAATHLIIARTEWVV